MMPRVLPILLAMVLVDGIAIRAQVAVHDAAVTARNTATAIAKEHFLATQREQHALLRRMAQRLSLFADLHRFVLSDVPRWRVHDTGAFLHAGAYRAALNFGDPTGAAYQAVSHALVPPASALDRLPPAARRALLSQLATVNLADATAIAATHGSGRLRFNGRRELEAIDVLERHVIDPSDEQSATAVLDKISGAALIGARQRQARTHLLAGIVEQLLVDGKRARDTEAASLNMQLRSWRDRRAANEAFVAGTGDALRTWRQP